MSRRTRDGFFAIPRHWEEGTLFSLPYPRSPAANNESFSWTQPLARCGSHEDIRIMNVGHPPVAATQSAKLTILLMDGNAGRRALRRKILGLHGMEVIGAGDLSEATSIWHRDRYDLVLIDIRRDYRGCIAWRDEIKKESPKQVVAFLVGQPGYVDLEPSPDSYIVEEHSAEWGASLHRAVREACSSSPQRNRFSEVGYRIAMARKLSGLPPRDLAAADPAENAQGPAYEASGFDETLLPGAETQAAHSLVMNLREMGTA